MPRSSIILIALLSLASLVGCRDEAARDLGRYCKLVSKHSGEPTAREQHEAALASWKPSSRRATALAKQLSSARDVEQAAGWVAEFATAEELTSFRCPALDAMATRAASEMPRCERLAKKLDQVGHALVPVFKEVYPEVIREVVPISLADEAVRTFEWEAEARLEHASFGDRHASEKATLLAAAGCPDGQPSAPDVCSIYQQRLPALTNNGYMRVLGESLGVALARTGEPDPAALAERAASLLSVRGDARMTSYLEPYMREFSTLLECELL